MPIGAASCYNGRYYIHHSKEADVLKRKLPQEEIFSSFDWWDEGCFLYQMTVDRCDYIQSCISRVSGKEALAQQEILEVGSGGGLICEQLAQRGAIMVGIEPSLGPLATAPAQSQEEWVGPNRFFSP